MIDTHVVTLRPADYSKLPKSGVYYAELVNELGHPIPIGDGTWIPKTPTQHPLYPRVHSAVVNIGLTSKLHDRLAGKTKDDLFEQLAVLNLPSGHYVRTTVLSGYSDSLKDDVCEHHLICGFALVCGALPILNGIQGGGSQHVRARRCTGNYDRAALNDIADWPVFRECIRALFTGLLSSPYYGLDCARNGDLLRDRVIKVIELFQTIFDWDKKVGGQVSAPGEVVLNTMHAGGRMHVIDKVDIYQTAPNATSWSQDKSDAFGDMAARLRDLGFTVGDTRVGTYADYATRHPWTEQPDGTWQP